MRCTKFIIICIFIFQCKYFSQENHPDFSIKDSTSILNPINTNDLQFKNFFRSDVNKRMRNDLMLGLGLYSKAINDSALLLQPNNIDQKYNNEEELESFKESFNLLMELAKKDRNKYDLGEVGNYLGLSRKVMAIILAIISIAK